MSDNNFYDDLTASLEEALAYKKGDKSRARVSVREIPIPEYDAATISQVREKMQLTQRAFALVLGVSPRTVEAWEAGINTPNGAARNLLYLLEKDNSLIEYLVMR